MNTVRPRLRLLVTAAPRLTPFLQTRAISWFNWGKSDSADKTASPVPDSSSRSITDLLKQSPRTAPTQQMPTRGTLAKSSIFADEEEADVPITSFNIDMSATRALRDPDRANWKWPKTVAARDIRRRGRLSRQATIAQTEKEHTAASHFIKTSVKKLSPLTRQIMGKSLDDAIVQMRFSPKKAARAMLAHLYHTRNEAVVRKGMAPEEMYISQAWVGRGPFEKGLNHRARGRIDMLMLPYTSVTLVVKEQATLDRIALEKEEKRLRKPVRQHLPNRPIYGQRQYYSW